MNKETNKWIKLWIDQVVQDFIASCAKTWIIVLFLLLWSSKFSILDIMSFAGQLTNQLRNLPTNKWLNKMINQPTNWPADWLTNQPTNKWMDKPTDRPTNRPSNQLTKLMNEETNKQTNNSYFLCCWLCMNKTAGARQILFDFRQFCPIFYTYPSNINGINHLISLLKNAKN